MLRNLFNKAVKEPLKALMSSNFVNAFNAMITPRQMVPALATARIAPTSRNAHLRL